MQKSDLLKYISNPENISKEELRKIEQLANKYPYFETTFNLLIRANKKLFPNQLENVIYKYAFLINDRKKLFNDIYNVHKLEQNKPQNIPTNENKQKQHEIRQKLKDNKEFEKNKSNKYSDDTDMAFIERQKKKHRKIIDDLIKPKVDQLSKLSGLLKKEKISEKEFLSDLNYENEQNKNKDENISSLQKEQEKHKIQRDQVWAANKVKKDDSTDTPENNIKNKVDIEDDIFSKVEKLKKAKLDENKIPHSHSEDNLLKNDNIIEKHTDENKNISDIQKPVIEKSSENKNVITTEKQKKKDDYKEDKSKIEIVENNKNEKIDKSADERDNNLSAADKILQKLKTQRVVSGIKREKIKKDISAEAVLDKLNTSKKRTKPEFEITEPGKISTKPESKETTEDKTTEKTETKVQTEKPQTSTISAKPESKETTEDKTTETKEEKASGPKTAADRILERIEKRRKQSKMQLIDKFLEEQPSIDRKREPETKEDLSAKSVKDLDVATERLAEIYTLQGLYDKAIETYEKLILKFPEKRTYFADKIKEIKEKQKK